MNLTTPPDVRDTEPDRAERVRADLVAMARRTTSRSRRPVWVPVLSAACTTGLVVTGVVLVPRLGDSRPSDRPGTPASSVTRPATTAPSRPAVTTAPSRPVAQSRIQLDLGPATEAEARRAARRCFTTWQGSGASGVPRVSDADTATIHSARWIRRPPGALGSAVPAPPRAIVQTLTTTAGVWVRCVGDQPQSSYDPAESREPRRNNASAKSPVSWSGGGPSTVIGPPWSMAAMIEFDVIPAITRVELRIQWSGGGTPWYVAVIQDGEGYVEAAAIGRPGVPQPGSTTLQIRGYDANGRQLYADNSARSTGPIKTK